MNEKIKKLKNKSLLNIMLFFVEFFILSSVFKSSLKGGSLFNLLNKTFPLLGKDILLLVSSLLMLASVSIRYVYAKYLNTSIDEYEKVVNNENGFKINQKNKIDEININKCNKEKSKLNNDDKNNIKEDYSYDELDENYNEFFLLDEDQERKKSLVKVYKR